MRIRHGLLFCILVLASLSRMPRADAHDVPGTAIDLDIGQEGIEIQIQLPLLQLADAIEKPIPRPLPEAAAEALRSYVAQHLRVTARDARPFEIRLRMPSVQTAKTGDVIDIRGELRAPAGASARWFELGFDAIAHRVVTHNIYVFVRHDLQSGLLGEEPELLGLLHYQNKSVVVDRTAGSAWQGFRSAFLLGTRHIAEGTDHLLFLLMLLLPATRVASQRRWSQPAGAARSIRETAKIVTAFTIGHSLTLVAGALGGAQLPVQLVEVLIALSILVSAIHAWRPLFAGREILIAAGFGLVHGLAFATVLRGFGADRSALWIGVLGFNLGVEAMQILLVTLTMPWLILLSRSPVYRVVRIGGAGLGAIAAGGWILQRACGIDTGIPAAVELLAAHAHWLLATLAVVASGAKVQGLWSAPSNNRLAQSLVPAPR